MAPVIVAHTAAGSAAGNTIVTSAIDTSGATHLTVGIAEYQPVAASTLSDSKGNTWTVRSTVLAASAQRVRLFECVNPIVGAGHTFTATCTSLSYPSIYVSAESGILTVAPFDTQTSLGNASSTSTAIPSLTPAGAGELFMAVVGIDAAFSSLAITAGYSILDQVAYGSGAHFGGALAYLVNAGSGAIAPTWSWTGVATDNAGAQAAFKPSLVTGGLFGRSTLDGLSIAGPKQFTRVA